MIACAHSIKRSCKPQNHPTNGAVRVSNLPVELFAIIQYETERCVFVRCLQFLHRILYARVRIHVVFVAITASAAAAGGLAAAMN